MPALPGGHGSPQPSRQNQPAEDDADRSQGLPQEKGAHDDTVQGKGVVKNHGAARPQGLYGPVPAPVAEDRWNNADVGHGGDRLGPKVHGNVPELENCGRKKQRKTQKARQRRGGGRRTETHHPSPEEGVKGPILVYKITNRFFL